MHVYIQIVHIYTYIYTDRIGGQHITATTSTTKQLFGQLLILLVFNTANVCDYIIVSI